MVGMITYPMTLLLIFRFDKLKSRDWIIASTLICYFHTGYEIKKKAYQRDFHTQPYIYNI